MIKIKRFINPAGLNKLEQIIDKRRISKSNNIPVVLKILKDIRSNKNKALKKYENKFSNNKRLKPSKTEINKAINSLSPKIKNAIDFAYNRIFKYHSLQKAKNISFKDKFISSLSFNS